MPDGLSQTEAKSVLKAVSIFADIKDNEEALSLLTGMMKNQKFPAGHTLIEQGTNGDEFYVLCDGNVSIFKKTPEEDRYKVVVLSHQSHPSFGEGGLMEGEIRSATIICDTPVECLVLARKDFESFCRQSPQFALPVLKKIAQSLMGRLNQTSNDLMLLHKALMDEIRNS